MAMSSFVEHVLELLDSLGPVRARAMMGGYVIFCGALPVALIADERLYLKADAESQGAFAAAGGEPFTYEQRGKAVQMSYWSPPDDALDAPESMRPWARLALEASARARRVRRPPRRRRAAKGTVARKQRRSPRR